MVKVHQLFVYNSLRNFMYVLEFNDKQALCIDPCDAHIVENFLKQHQLDLVGIINTHEHFDHIEGNSYLSSKYGCSIFCSNLAKEMISISSQGLRHDEIITLDNFSYLRVVVTPGHCSGHICLLLYESSQITGVFSGDLLFNAGVGNTKGGGNVRELYQSVFSLMSMLPKTCLLYPGHDYVKTNTSFARTLERENDALLTYYSDYLDSNSSKNYFISTIEQELRVNPFLRLSSKEILSYLRAKGLPCETHEEVFHSLRLLRDEW